MTAATRFECVDPEAAWIQDIQEQCPAIGGMPAAPAEDSQTHKGTGLSGGPL